jgi:hypothetical protein
MKGDNVLMHVLSWFVIVTLIAPLETMPSGALAQEQEAKKSFKQEELDQMLAPIALYPDSLLSQILMASTYPLDIVQASRWANRNEDLKGDALTAALEKQNWDPSVKSLVNFPQVLEMMNEKLDWTGKLGDAFLAQEKDVMDTIQQLRAKAQTAGNLKTTKEQTVVVEKETIIIEPASPQVIYVPAYNPAVVYGPWWYPAYPPYYYYPPGYVAGAAAFSFVAGVAVGAAWGYAWGGCNWHGGNVDIDINRNADINRNINRDKYAQQWQQRGQSGRGKWQHDPGQRKGVAYRDSATARKFGQSSARSASTRDARGFGESRQPGSQARDLGGGARGDAGRTSGMQRSSGRENAFSGAGSGSQERMASQRGQASRSQSLSGSRGGVGGGARGGGRGGGRR